jgi:hypothetical protein
MHPLIIELARTLIVTILASVFSMLWIGYFFKQQGPEIAKSILAMDEKQLQQLQGVDKRIDKTMSKKIANDIIENSPLSQLLGLLTEETREYIKLHPERFPQVLQQYAGTLELGVKLLPEIQKYLGQSIPREKLDY